MKRTDRTLLEQMQISDIEILRRKELLGLNSENLLILSSQKIIIEENIDAIVNEFYEQQTEIDEISLLIGDADTLSRLRAAQRRYVIDLFSGSYDSNYVNNRLRIGLVHKRIGVEPKLYLSAIRTLKEIIMATLKDFIINKETLETCLITLDKLLYFDTTLVFDTYIESLVGEIENAKNRTEIYAKSLEDKVAERTKQLEKLTKLDPLTNIYNQRALQDLLRKEIAYAKRRQTNIALVYFDIDNFKQVNDSFGHLKGDEVLKTIGHCLANNIRETDIACRYGGDEFCLIFPDCDIEGAISICNKVIDEFNQKYPDFSLSMGIVDAGPDAYFEDEQFIKIADKKMYLAKKQAGSYIQV